MNHSKTFAFALSALVLTLAAGASAQGRGRAAAAEAFDRGTQEALTQNWETAAQWFETADRLSPASVALSNAIEARRQAGQQVRAASLALRLQATYPNDEAAQAYAAQVLEGAAANYVRIDVSCDANCVVESDGSLTGGMSFFVEPGREHEIAATFEHGRVAQTVEGRPGQTRAVSFEAPPPPPEPVATVGADGQPLVLSEPFRFPKATFIVAGALTLGAGAVMLWSGIDTQNHVGAYEEQAMLCNGGDSAACDEGRRLLRDGQSRERRTNALIGVTAGLAATTLVIAILTDWSGSDDDEDASSEDSQGVTPSVGLSRQGGMLLLEGTF
ncbi:MAG: hypothetical protein KC593_08155 [Myxococcales bacterium]|nr:hypothetical protein [Myxococcales bacterium]MCB9626130.1 hypothetical protein [Sandaracinaceae bacterium]